MLGGVPRIFLSVFGPASSTGSLRRTWHAGWVKFSRGLLPLENFEERNHYSQASFEENEPGSVPYLRIYNRDRRLHIVDANPTTCEFLGVHFRMEGFQVACSLDSDHFLATLSQRCPDVVLINLQVGERSGLDLLKSVRALRTGTPVFMLSDSGQLDAAVMAMKLGAVDVFSKPFDSEFLSSAVHDALRRDIQVGAVQDGRGRTVEVRGFSKLTAREREVLQLIAEGHSNKEAGRQLGISPRTVEVHRARVMDKLGAKNAADLMRIVLTS